MNNKDKKLRVAAVADIHVGKTPLEELSRMFSEISEKADILLLCGDLTERGKPEEAEILAKELTTSRIPVVAILGNHDFEDEQPEEIKKILSESGATMLDGTYHIYKNVGFAGVKGFCGGFENYMLQSWGEKVIKDFVHETVKEVLKLENALSRIEAEKKVVLIHYSPIPDTIEGEPKEIYPFMGSSRFVEPINLYNVTAVFHGHGHIGIEKGKTSKNISVYNVAYPLLKKLKPEQPYQIVEI